MNINWSLVFLACAGIVGLSLLPTLVVRCTRRHEHRTPEEYQ